MISGCLLARDNCELMAREAGASLLSPSPLPPLSLARSLARSRSARHKQILSRALYKIFIVHLPSSMAA